MSNKEIEDESTQKSGSSPSLRFPEFQGENGWNMERLEDVAPLQRGFDLPSTQIRPGTIPVFYSNGVQSFHEEARANAPGLVTGRSGTIGKLHFIEEGEYWPHNTCLWVTSFNGNVPKFVYYLYKFIGMDRFASGSGVPTLNRNDVHAFYSYVPVSAAEQQKIADCLTSADELVAAETRKLGTLKVHKQGLMQQLFCTDGEELPGLRFEQFRDNGRWNEYTIGDVASVTTGNKDTQDKVPDGLYPFFVRSQTVERMDTFSYDGEAILTSGDGVGVGKNFHYVVGKFDFHQRVYCIFNFHENVLGKFVFYCFADNFYKRAMQMNAKNSVDSVRMAMITEMPIKVPALAEQRAVVECISSLDEQIDEQSRKIDLLNKHKTGLIQQLFPVMDEVQA